MGQAHTFAIIRDAEAAEPTSGPIGYGGACFDLYRPIFEARGPNGLPENTNPEFNTRNTCKQCWRRRKTFPNLHISRLNDKIVTGY